MEFVRQRRQRLRNCHESRRREREMLELRIGTPFTTGKSNASMVTHHSDVYTSKRSFHHPDYDMVHRITRENQGERILLQQLHRQRELDKLYERQRRRKQLQETIGTSFARRSSSKKQRSQSEKSKRQSSPLAGDGCDERAIDSMAIVDHFSRIHDGIFKNQ